MKKYCFLSAVVVLGAMAASCNKEASSQEPVVNPQEKEEISVYDAPAFTASFAKNETKSYIGDAEGGYYQPLWDTTKDRVCINNGSMSAVVESEDGGLTASFLMSTESEYPEAPYCAVTPHNAFNKDHSTFDPETKTMKVMVAGTGAPQRYTKVNGKPTYYASAPIMAAYSEDGNFEFKNKSLFYKLTIGGGSDTDNIKMIYVRQGEKASTPNIAGQWNLQFKSADDITLKPYNLTALLAYDCGEGGIAQNTPIVITVPAYDFEDGLIFTIKDVNGHFASFKVASATAEAAGTVFTKEIAFSPASGQIRTADDWNAFAAAVNGEKNDWDLYRWVGNGTVELANDIEAENLTQVNTFKYKLDGKGYTITRSGATTPLVATLTGTISNLQLKGAFAQAPFQGSPLVNVLSGGTIENCTNYMDLASDVTADHVMLSGIVRLVSAGTVENCNNYGNITASIDISSASYNMQCGGIVAQLYPDADQTVTIEGCCNYGKISAVPYFETTGHANAVNVCGLGGVVGWVRFRQGTSVVLDNCDNSGEVFYSAEHVSSPDGTKATSINVGGIVGLAAKMEVSGSSVGILNTPNGANGLNIELRKCDNSGKVYNCGVNYSNGAQAGNKSFTGGLVGSVVGNLAQYARFENCTNTGDVQTYDLTGSDSNARPAYCAVAGGMVGFGAYLNFNGCTVNCKIGGGKRPVASISGLIGYCVNKFNVIDCTIFYTGYFQRVSGFSGNRSIVATVPVKYDSSAMGIVPNVQGSTITGCTLGAKVRTNTNTLSSDTKADLLSSGYNVTIPASVSATGNYLVCGNGFTTNSGVTLSDNTYWDGN